MTIREVFPNAPLAMVVAETKFSYVPELDQSNAKVEVLAAIKSMLPVMERTVQNSVEIKLGADGSVQPQTKTLDLLQARAPDSQTTAAVSSESLTVAMSGLVYTKFEESLRPLLEAAIGGLQNVFPSTYVTRAGLRYLDEIRVPSPPSSLDGWARWIAVPLLGGAELLSDFDSSVVEMRSTYRYDLPDKRQVVFNWGPFVGTGVVGPDHPFHRADVHPESMFVLDLDASWMPTGALEPLSTADLLVVYDGLHEPAQAVFQRAITDEARTLFRSKQ